MTGAIIFSAAFFRPPNLFSNLFSAAVLFSLSEDCLSFSTDFSSIFCSLRIVFRRSSSLLLISSRIFSALSPTGDCMNFCMAPPGAFTIAPPPPGNALPPPPVTVAACFLSSTLLTNFSKSILSPLFLNPSFLSSGVSVSPPIVPLAVSSSIYC